MTGKAKFSRAAVKRVMRQVADVYVDRHGSVALTPLVEDVASGFDIDLDDDSTDWMWDYALEVSDWISRRGQ